MSAISRLLPFLIASMIMAGCAFEGGEPWGWIEAEIVIEALPPSGSVTLNEQFATFETLQLLGPAGTAGGEFDPANPPPGYTLCHQDHCHAVDGSLESYDEIIAKMAASDGPAALLTRRLAVDVELPSEIEETLKIIEPLSANEAEITVDEIRLRGILSGDDDVELRIRLGLVAIQHSVPIALDVGRHWPAHQILSLRLVWPDDLFEGLDFSTATVVNDGQLIRIDDMQNTAIHDELIQRIAEGAELVGVTQ